MLSPPSWVSSRPVTSGWRPTQARAAYGWRRIDVSAERPPRDGRYHPRFRQTDCAPRPPARTPAVDVDCDNTTCVRLGRDDGDRVPEHGGHAERVDRAHCVRGGAAGPADADRGADGRERVGRPDLAVVVEDDRIGLGELGQDRVRAGPEAAGQPFQLAAGRRPARSGRTRPGTPDAPAGPGRSGCRHGAPLTPGRSAASSAFPLTRQELRAAGPARAERRRCRRHWRLPGGRPGRPRRHPRRRIRARGATGPSARTGRR